MPPKWHPLEFSCLKQRNCQGCLSLRVSFGGVVKYQPKRQLIKRENPVFKRSDPAPLWLHHRIKSMPSYWIHTIVSNWYYGRIKPSSRQLDTISHAITNRCCIVMMTTQRRQRLTRARARARGLFSVSALSKLNGRCTSSKKLKLSTYPPDMLCRAHHHATLNNWNA